MFIPVKSLQLPVEALAYHSCNLYNQRPTGQHQFLKIAKIIPNIVMCQGMFLGQLTGFTLLIHHWDKAYINDFFLRDFAGLFCQQI